MGRPPLRESPPPLFIDTKRDGVHAQGIVEVVVLSPNCRGAVVEHCGVWRRAWQSSWASSLVLQRSRRRHGGSSGRRGHCCGGYRPPGMAWRRSEGPTGQGLILVKAGAASEGRAHAVRGLRGRESTKEVWGVGSIVAGAVPSTSCTASQVLTVSSQRPEWRSSDRGWRTGLRSQPLWGMAA